MMGSDKAASRRRYSQKQKLQVMAECDATGNSVAKVAMAHGINANVVHRWRQAARGGKTSTLANTGQFVAVSVDDAPALTNAADIQIQLRRGPTAVTITWPVAAAGACAAWMRELLR